MRLATVLLGLVSCCCFDAIATSKDALPSWNEGHSKLSIIDMRKDWRQVFPPQAVNPNLK